MNRIPRSVARHLTPRRLFNRPTGPTATHQKYIDLEFENGAFNYAPLPVVIESGEGAILHGVDGEKYFDFLSAYSAVNQGHCHPRIRDALIKQSAKLTLTSRAFYNNQLGEYEKFMTDYFGFERLLPMNTGVEAAETAVKLARRWAYDVKGVPANQAKIILARNNFWGRSIAALSSSTDPVCREGFGPYLEGFGFVDFNDLDQLREVVQDPTVAAFMVEPIQGEAGVVVPQEGYLREAKKICNDANVLLICDEIQTGIARTGKRLACDYDDTLPDILVLGKALSGGFYPVSAVLSSDEIMLTIRPGQHGSTYGGNPLGCAIAMEALRVVEDEALAHNAYRQGKYLRSRLEAVMEKNPHISTVRGRGLLNAVVVEPVDGKSASDVCYNLADKGLLAKPTHDHIIRLAPPLCIKDDEIDEALDILESTLSSYPNI